MKARLAKLKEEEQELRRGLGIFRIDHPFSKDIQNLEKVNLINFIEELYFKKFRFAGLRCIRASLACY